MPSLQLYNQNLTRREAAHLIRRCSIAYSAAHIDTLEGISADAAVDYLINLPLNSPSPPIDPDTGTTFYEREELTSGANPAILRIYLRNWWIKQMVETGNPLQEKMVLFWHTHFTTDESKVGLSFPMYHQNALFRNYALDSFKVLAKKICRDSAMSVFLDGYTNTSIDPNENFAREFLELYSIGKGEQIGSGDYTTYTEEDIREAAKVLTGIIPWAIVPDAQIPGGSSVETDPDTGLYHCSLFPLLHDASTKQFSAAFQNTSISTGANTVSNIEAELDAFIDMIFNQSACATFLCRKLYRFFVYYEITEEIETDIIAPMATLLQNSNYQIGPVLSLLLKSEHFYDSDDAIEENNSLGAIVKSPAELVAGAVRYFDVNLGSSSNWAAHHEALSLMDGAMAQMDMPIMRPPEVAGFPAYHQAPSYNRNWISGTSLINRFAAIEFLVAGVPLTVGELKLDTVDFVQNGGIIASPSDPNNIVETITNDLFPVGVDPTKFDALKNLLTDGDPDSFWTVEWDLYVNTSNDIVVRSRLNNLFNSILQSPEFQLS